MQKYVLELNLPPVFTSTNEAGKKEATLVRQINSNYSNHFAVQLGYIYGSYDIMI